MAADDHGATLPAPISTSARSSPRATDASWRAGATSISYAANELNQYNTVGSASPTYDEDGNLLNDGTKQLAYNAENQLRSVRVPDVSVSTYDYDYMGRRIRKSVHVLSGSSSDYVVNWIYDGWNKIQEIKSVSGGSTTTKNFAWGLDFSQSMQGAGGIGGLIAVVDGSGSASLFSYDGNGNISELVDAATGSISAHYEYDAFGNTVLATGTAAADNAYRFSTKYADDETGLVYYGYRYYDSERGRWLNRDPIGETGGLNLYRFVANHALDALDPDGRKCRIKRDGAQYAAVECDSCDDGLHDVSKLAKLDIREYEKWLQATDGKGVPAAQSGPFGTERSFKVPNTVYVVIGPLNQNWVDSTLNVRVMSGLAHEKAADYASTGYRVVTDDAVNREQLLQYMYSEDVFGISYFGHGPGFNVRDSYFEGKEAFITVRAALSALHHGLGILDMIGCDTADPTQYDKLVTSAGLFVGVEGSHYSWNLISNERSKGGRYAPR